MNETMSDPTAGVAAEPAAETLEPHFLTAEEMPAILRFSEMLRRFVDRVGRFGAWFAMPMILITTFDLFIRKTGVFQIWLVENVSEYFGSTLLQELEWHAHTVLFSLVLGFGYIWNTHVRVDLIRERLDFRKRAWIELIGLTFFLLPFCTLVVYFAVIYAYDSWVIGEVSASLVGMSHRWVIKSILAIGLIVALLAGIAVWLQIAVALFGPQHWRFPLMTVEWEEDVGKATEGKERMDMDTVDDQLEVRASEQKTILQSQQQAGE